MRHIYQYIIFILVCTLPSYTSAEKLPVEAFASLPSIDQVKLSPSGDKILFLSRLDTEEEKGTLVNVFNLIDNKSTHPLATDNTKFKIAWVDWANDDKILISARFPEVRQGTPTVETRLFTKNVTEGKLQNILSKSFYNNLIWPPQFQDNVIDLLPNEPNAILLSISKEDPYSALVYKVDVRNQKRKIVQRIKRNIDSWITDRQHRVRAGLYWKDTEFQIYVKNVENNKWRKLWRYNAFSEDKILPLGFDLDPNILYVSAYHNGFKAIFKTDLRLPEPKLELIYSDENYDVNGHLLYSNKTGELIGTTYAKNGGYTFWHPDYKALQLGINKALPETQNYIVHFNKDETKYIVKTTSYTDAGTYYIGDRVKKTLSIIGRQFDSLDPDLMSKKLHFNYTARDGLDIQAYITLPKNYKEDSAIPTIIFPHGGPISHESAGFDYWAQFFANRGYAVLQMDFRGSSGYGYDFMTAGLQNWGKAMQDDIEDGVKALIKKGIAAPEKICIAGASYGGYAALMGTIKTPDLYQCAISFAGVTDVKYLVSKAKNYVNYDIVKKQIGSNSKQLKEISPVNHAKKIQVPILLIHGSDDRQVRVNHSRMMRDKLKSAGKNVEFIELEKGDHYLSKNSHRIATFKAIDAFLEKHLPVN